jgi:hypothetical protein
MHRAALVTPLFLFLGCATSLQPGAEKVQVVTAGQKERQCKSLGIFTMDQRLGPNKPGNALNKALNEVSRRGGNGIYLISNSVDWAEGAAVSAEALQYQMAP